MDVTLPLWLLLALVAAVAILGLLIWSSRRTLVGDVTAVALDGIEELLPNLAALTGEPILDGNRVEVLQNGRAFFDAVLADIEQARSSVHYESYVWWRGDICWKLARALAERARQGVEVRLLLDAQGSLPMEREVEDLLDEAGCQVAHFHPFRLRDLGKVNSRDHRKIAVVDGRIAYFMGHGVADEWCGGTEEGAEYRDTAVRIQGPAVRSAQTIFLRNWVNVHDELVIDTRHFPELERRGEARVHVAHSDPVGNYSEVEVLLKVAVASARERILIQNPYFAPHESVLDLLGRAAEGGVDVQIMLPRKNDSRLVRHASHKYYGPLLRRGVRIHEYLPAFAHQKVVVVDGHWSNVGSTNFDHRSLQINREVSVGILDREVAEVLTAAFEEDLEQCEEVTLRSWRRRHPIKRLGDGLAYLIREQI